MLPLGGGGRGPCNKKEKECPPTYKQILIGPALPNDVHPPPLLLISV